MLKSHMKNLRVCNPIWLRSNHIMSSKISISWMASSTHPNCMSSLRGLLSTRHPIPTGMTGRGFIISAPRDGPKTTWKPQTIDQALWAVQDPGWWRLFVWLVRYDLLCEFNLINYHIEQDTWYTFVLMHKFQVLHRIYIDYFFKQNIMNPSTLTKSIILDQQIPINLEDIFSPSLQS